MRGRFAILLAVAAMCATTALAGWAPEEQLTRNRYHNGLEMPNGHRIVVADNGIRHLVWYANSSVYYKRYYPGSGWTSDYVLSSGSGSYGPSIALDPNGRDIHVVWGKNVGKGRTETHHLYYQKCVPGTSGNGGWVGVPFDLTPMAVPATTWPAIATFRDPNGVNHVVAAWHMMYDDSVGFREYVGTQWDTLCYLHGPWGAGASITPVSITADPQSRFGDVFLGFWVSYQGTRTIYVMRRQGNVWQQPELAALSDTTIMYVSAEVDRSTGYPHLALCNSTSADRIYPPFSHVYHTCWNESTGWQPLEMLSGSSVWSYYANMCFVNGSAVVVWAESSSAVDRGIRYTTGNYGNWAPPVWLKSTLTASTPNVNASSSGSVFVVWGNGHGSNSELTQIWGRFYTPDGGGGMAQPGALPQSSIEISPNPARSGRVTVRYSLPHAEPLTVTLLDVSGREVRRSAYDARSSGEGSFALDVSGLNAGVYVARLVAGDLTVSKSLVVQH